MMSSMVRKAGVIVVCDSKLHLLVQLGSYGIALNSTNRARINKPSRGDAKFVKRVVHI